MITIVNGSNRPNNLTSIFASYVYESLQQDEAEEVVLLNLAD